MNLVLHSPAAEAGRHGCADVKGCAPIVSILHKAGAASGAVLSEQVGAQGAWSRDGLFSSPEPASQACLLRVGLSYLLFCSPIREAALGDLFFC